MTTKRSRKSTMDASLRTAVKRMRGHKPPPLMPSEERRKILFAPFPTVNIHRGRTWGGASKHNDVPIEGQRVWPSGTHDDEWANLMKIIEEDSQ